MKLTALLVMFVAARGTAADAVAVQCPDASNGNVVIAHQFECSSFYLCDGSPTPSFLLRCPTGMLFGEEGTMGTGVIGGGCVQEAECRPQVDVSAVPAARGARALPRVDTPGDYRNYTMHLANPANCSQFYRYEGDVEPQLFECPSGLGFDPVLESCDSKVKCRSPSCQHVPPPVCPPNNDKLVHLPHPTDCTKFYKCNWGNPVLFDCPDHLYFNPDSEVCDWPRNVPCDRCPPGDRADGEPDEEVPEDEVTDEYVPEGEPTGGEGRIDARFGRQDGGGAAGRANAQGQGRQPERAGGPSSKGGRAGDRPNYGQTTASGVQPNYQPPSQGYQPSATGYQQPVRAYQPTNNQQPGQGYQPSNQGYQPTSQGRQPGSSQQPNQGYQPTNSQQPGQGYQPTNQGYQPTSQGRQPGSSQQPNQGYQPTNRHQPGQGYQPTNQDYQPNSQGRQPGSSQQPNQGYQPTNRQQPGQGYQPTNQDYQPNSQGRQPGSSQQPNRGYQPENRQQPGQEHQPTDDAWDYASQGQAQPGQGTRSLQGHREHGSRTQIHQTVDGYPVYQPDASNPPRGQQQPHTPTVPPRSEYQPRPTPPVRRYLTAPLDNQGGAGRAGSYQPVITMAPVGRYQPEDQSQAGSRTDSQSQGEPRWVDGERPAPGPRVQMKPTSGVGGRPQYYEPDEQEQSLDSQGRQPTDGAQGRQWYDSQGRLLQVAQGRPPSAQQPTPRPSPSNASPQPPPSRDFHSVRVFHPESRTTWPPARATPGQSTTPRYGYQLRDPYQPLDQDTDQGPDAGIEQVSYQDPDEQLYGNSVRPQAANQDGGNAQQRLTTPQPASASARAHQRPVGGHYAVTARPEVRDYQAQYDDDVASQPRTRSVDSQMPGLSDLRTRPVGSEAARSSELRAEPPRPVYEHVMRIPTLHEIGRKA